MIVFKSFGVIRISLTVDGKTFEQLGRGVFKYNGFYFMDVTPVLRPVSPLEEIARGR